MGLFDFVRDIGKKLFNREDEAASKIKAEIESSNPGVNGLNVNYDPANGKVALSGAATSAEAMQKAVENPQFHKYSPFATSCGTRTGRVLHHPERRYSFQNRQAVLW